MAPQRPILIGLYDCPGETTHETLWERLLRYIRGGIGCASPKVAGRGIKIILNGLLIRRRAIIRIRSARALIPLKPRPRVFL